MSVASYTKKQESLTLPLVILRESFVFPHLSFSFDIDMKDTENFNAVKMAAYMDSPVFLTSFDDEQETSTDSETKDSLHYFSNGSVVHIKQLFHPSQDSVHVLVEGVYRAKTIAQHTANHARQVDVIATDVFLPDFGGARGKALVNRLLKTVGDNLQFFPSNTENLMKAFKNIADPGTLADFITANILTDPKDKQKVLELVDPFKRAEFVITRLTEEASIMKEEFGIHCRVNARLERNHKEYYLREQIKVIQEELGDADDDESAEFAMRIQKTELSKEAEAKLKKENNRLAKLPPNSVDAALLANYLDTCLSLPWGKKTKDRINFETVQKVLDHDHNGLEKVKERIVEYVAAKQLNPDLNGQILCLVGPPGVGKTSIAASVARALNRKYVRISLGGIRDEADIRGHRKTYIGSMPGRLISALLQVGVSNPLILLDEIDKMAKDGHGDPTAALLEVLDGEQNKTFRDHYIEIPFDLSDCMFLATANTLDGIPRPLLDRMEIIELSIYTKHEKMAIAKDHLLPKQLKRHGMNKKMLKITDAALEEIIDFYTREAGVRTLERTLAAICRKVGKKLLSEAGVVSHITIDRNDIKSYLGAPKILPEQINEFDEVGCVNGLAYTELGGTLLKVEVAVLDGSGKIETTGSLGDVMKESAQIAVSYVRSVAKEYGIPTDFYKAKDIHIHFPEGAVPKDGPSAGVTMVTALISALTGRQVRHDVAMTGEISLRGNVLPIGGLKEKTMAAYTAGVQTVLIPEENLRDMDDLDATVRNHLNLVPCRKATDILKTALLPLPSENTTIDDRQEAIVASNFIPVTSGISDSIRP